MDKKKQDINKGIETREAGAIQDAEQELFIGFVVLIISIVIIFLAYKGVFIPQDEKPGAWFARSGAAVTVLSLFSFDANNRIYQILNPIGTIGGCSIVKNTNKLKSFLFYSKILKVISFIIAIIGTLIWGYGELLF